MSDSFDIKTNLANLPQGRIDTIRVDATTDADIQRQIKDDVAEAMKAAATYRQPSP